MNFASLYSLWIISSLKSFETTAIKVHLNTKYTSFSAFNNATFIKANVHVQRKYKIYRRKVEINLNNDTETNYRGRYRERKTPLQNRKFQTRNVPEEIFAVTDIGQAIKRSRRKRDSNIRCHGLCERSLCQWTDSWDFDKYRNPAFIPKAKCSSKCRLNSGNVVIPNVLNMYTACEPIKRDIPIFKNNEKAYIKDWPVACACTIKHISILQNKQRKVRHKTKHEKLRKGGQRRRIKVKSKYELNISRYFEVREKLLQPFLFLPEFKK
ncbi:uncharacterized protein LOC132738183 [Ruditapes philippinarum]|uniref:uncharacterized protein LOC132738183 n=1 Tax=Ruditapes philippinarum TaxID=129788 RepID=UPI00295AF99D|nr:uncharacterized protein LOC132738183 [Ruditapes philippinarum]